jgi:hypothetical protein
MFSTVRKGHSCGHCILRISTIGSKQELSAKISFRTVPQCVLFPYLTFVPAFGRFLALLPFCGPSDRRRLDIPLNVIVPSTEILDLVKCDPVGRTERRKKDRTAFTYWINGNSQGTAGPPRCVLWHPLRRIASANSQVAGPGMPPILGDDSESGSRRKRFQLELLFPDKNTLSSECKSIHGARAMLFTWLPFGFHSIWCKSSQVGRRGSRALEALSFDEKIRCLAHCDVSMWDSFSISVITLLTKHFSIKTF